MVVPFPLILSVGSSFKCMCWSGLSWTPSGNPLEFSRAPTLSSSFLSASKSCSSSQLGLPSSWFCLDSGMIPGSTWDPCTLAWNLSGQQALKAPLTGIPPLRDRSLSFLIWCPMSWKPLLAQGTRVGGGRAPEKGVGWSKHRGPESEGSEQRDKHRCLIFLENSPPHPTSIKMNLQHRELRCRRLLQRALHRISS